MNILSTFPKKRKRKVVVGFVGTCVPQSQSDYLTLYCNAFSTTKTNIIKNFFNNWIKDKEVKYPLDRLVILNAEKAFEVWENTEGQSFESFIKLLESELKKKKLSPTIISEIIKLVEYEKSKKK